MKLLAWCWRLALLLALVANGIGLPAIAHAGGASTHCQHHAAHDHASHHHGGHHEHGADTPGGHGCCGGPHCHCGCTLPPGLATNPIVAAAQVHFAQALPPDSHARSLTDPRAPLRPPIV